MRPEFIKFQTGDELRAEWDAKHKADYDANHWEAIGYLDVNEKNPDLFGEAILLRDDDGMGFSLGLDRWKGKRIKITIERIP